VIKALAIVRSSEFVINSAFLRRHRIVDSDRLEALNEVAYSLH
jgi:hypothetical protein